MWKKTSDLSGSRNLLILHRALQYVVAFLAKLGIEKKQQTMLRLNYKQHGVFNKKISIINNMASSIINNMASSIIKNMVSFLINSNAFSIINNIVSLKQYLIGFIKIYFLLEHIDEEEKCTNISREAYESTLMKYHPWVVQVFPPLTPSLLKKKIKYINSGVLMQSFFNCLKRFKIQKYQIFSLYSLLFKIV